MPKNWVVMSVYDYLPTYNEVEVDDASTGQWDNRTTDSTAEQIIGSIALASKSEIDRSRPYQQWPLLLVPLFRRTRTWLRKLRTMKSTRSRRSLLRGDF